MSWKSDRPFGDKSTIMTLVTTTGSGKVRRKSSPMLFFWVCLACVVFLVRLAFPNSKFHPFNRGGYVTNGLWRLPARDDVCNGSRIYMYDLPPEFNVGLYIDKKCNQSLIPWMDLCPRFSNSGYGLKLREELPESAVRLFRNTLRDDLIFDSSSWFDTDSYMLEVIFHNRMKTYYCLTSELLSADAFFVPYYTGLHALVHLYIDPDKQNIKLTYDKRKDFGKDLVAWLEANGGEAWRRHGGRDHFLVLGRTTWDFKLFPDWGTGFSSLPKVVNMTKLLMERDPFQVHEQGVPYATPFHPSSPEKLSAWLEVVNKSERKFQFSYVGAPRADSWSVRGIVSATCSNAGESVCKFVNCSVVRCSHDPMSTYRTFLHSDFCLQPRGDSATRRSVFDCLISGAIPVLFHRDSAYSQYSWHLPPDSKSYSVFIPEKDIKKGVSIQQVLSAYTPDRIREMRRTILSIIPKLLYNGYANDPWDQEKDAFELSVEKVLGRIAALKSSMAEPDLNGLGYSNPEDDEV